MNHLREWVVAHRPSQDAAAIVGGLAGFVAAVTFPILGCGA
jgi:hypothetical protein